MSEPPAVAGGPSNQTRELVALSVDNIINRALQTKFIPQISSASLINPRAIVHLPARILSHLPRRVGFEGVQRKLGSLCSDRNNNVYMIGSHVDSVQCPLSKRAGFADRRFHRFASRSVQRDRLTL